jgi:hypothetical protein
MAETTQKRTFGDRVNERFKEAPGEIFKRGKWSFWFPMVIGLTLLNSGLTATIFLTKSLYSDEVTFDLGKGLFIFLGIVIATVGALICWTETGNLHYSDSDDSRLARGVSILDSATIIFIVAHFCILFYVQGHLITLCADESKYEKKLATFNASAIDVSKDNVKIAELGAKTSENNAKTARLNNDAAYQLRKAFESGAGAQAKVGRQKIDAASQSPSLQTSQVQLIEPEKPKESSTAFLESWEIPIRILNFGELILGVITLIYIRNRSAKFNGFGRTKSTSVTNDEFPSEIDADQKSNPKKAAFVSRKTDDAPKENDTVSLHSKRKETTRVETQPQRVETPKDGLRKLRAYLKEISFYHPGNSFKVDVKSDYVWIRMMESENGREETISSTKCAPSILDDVIEMMPDAFKARLIKFLKAKGFPIETAT